MSTRATRKRTPSRKLLESSEVNLAVPRKVEAEKTNKQAQSSKKGKEEKELPLNGDGEESLNLLEGNARGKGKGKGSKGQVNKGKGKGRRTSRQLPEEDILLELQKDRQKRIKEEVNLLPDGTVRHLLCQAAERDPTILHRIEAASESQPGGSSPPPERPVNIPPWCVCHHCRDMPTDVEKRCCRRTPPRCMSESREVATLVLDPLVLYIFRMYRADVFALQNINEGDLNRQNRHAAYRCYILWQYGKLRSGDRRVIPSCIVWKIRDTYPDPHSNYTGFLRGRLG